MPIKAVLDYASGLSPTDMLELRLANGRVLLRPSGTEPKLKLYYSAAADTREAAHDMVAALREEMGRRLK